MPSSQYRVVASDSIGSPGGFHDYLLWLTALYMLDPTAKFEHGWRVEDEEVVVSILRQRGVLAGIVSLAFLVAVVSLMMRSGSDAAGQKDSDFAVYEPAQTVDVHASQKEPAPAKDVQKTEREPAPEPAPEAAPENPGNSAGQQRAAELSIPAEPKEKAPLWDPDSVESTDPLPDDWQPSISQVDVMKALEKIKPNIQQCYDTLLQDFPDAAGMVRIRFIVKTENTMAHVQLSEIAEPTTLLDSDLHNCMSEIVGSIVLPRAKNDAQVMILQRFQFQPDEGVTLILE